VRSKHDPERRARMEDLRDDEPLFVSRRGHHLRIAASVSTGGDCARRRSARFAPHQFVFRDSLCTSFGTFTRRSALRSQPSSLRVTANGSALVAAVQHDLFWQSSDTVLIYNHAISNADAHEKLQIAYIDRLKSQPRSSGLRNRGHGWLRKHARGGSCAASRASE
jgi:hypothetical protein